MAYDTDVTVLGGLLITVEFTVSGAEPDVGIMGEGVDEWYVTHIAGRALRKGEKCDWLYNRINAAKGEEDRIIEACLAAAPDGYDDYDDYRDDY